MLPILKIPTESLRQPSVDVERDVLLSKEIQQFAQDMIETMYDDDGIGLAAPQVGKNIRICVIGKEADKKLKNDIILINPVWERLTKKTGWDTEGCLSVPNTYGSVKRYKDIQVTALDEKGNEVSFEAHGFFARVVQHEVDHLNGVLFIDKAKKIQKVETPNTHAL